MSHSGGPIPKPRGGLAHVNGSPSVCSGAGCVCVRVRVSVCRHVCEALGSRELPWSEPGTTASAQGTGTTSRASGGAGGAGDRGRGTRLASPVTSLSRAAGEGVVGSSRARPGSRDVAEELHSSRGRQEEAEGGSPSLSCTQRPVRLLQGPPQQSGRRCPPHLQALAVYPESPPHLRPLWLFPSLKQEAVLPSRDSSTKQTCRYPCGEPVGINDRLRVSPQLG